MYAGRTPTYYDDEAQSLAIATDYDILVDDETLNPSPLHVEDESAHAREVQEGCKRIRAECRRNMMAMMAMALAFLAMALLSIHTSLHRPYGFFFDSELAFLFWCMVLGASTLVAWVLCKQPNLHDSGDEDEAPSAARDRDASGLLAEAREGCNNLPAKYRRGTECVWPCMAAALCWTIVWSFYNELPVPVYECLLLLLLWCIVMGSSILVAWVLNDKPDVYESDYDNVEGTSNTPQEVPSARGEGGVSLLEEAQNNGSTKFPGRYRGGIAGVFLLALSVTLVSYDYFSKFKHLKFFPIAWLVVHMVIWGIIIGVSVLLYRVLSVRKRST
mmetsp:Transcript_38972/g.70199  ORF Transcript_38972/g.70199 Transcript_38972/m.70199 type:complete len:330 (+) Transcript_38972:95-1084(+)